MKKMITIILIILIYNILLGSWTLKYTNAKKSYRHKYKFNGLVWVSLDMYSIHKYNSSDIPKSIIEHTKTKL